MNTQFKKAPKRSLKRIMPVLERLGHHVLLSNNSKQKEYNFAWRHLSSCEKILDVGCGVGLFMNYAPDRIIGVDINPFNVEFCKSNGYKAFTGNALKLDFADNSFDGVHSSHVMHIFTPDQAMTFVKELCRVCKPGGKIVVALKHDHQYFWQNPENSRPYPPCVFYYMSVPQASSEKPKNNPMWEELPQFEPVDIKYRRPPLYYFMMYGSRNRLRISAALNVLQCRFGLKKYWSFDAYSIVLENKTQ
jgi:ubiquinone/menaquinone biosynthesis C-methylase UbiE